MNVVHVAATRTSTDQGVQEILPTDAEGVPRVCLSILQAGEVAEVPADCLREHPAAELLSPVPTEQFELLCRDVGQQGVTDPLSCLLAGDAQSMLLLDGRERLKAARIHRQIEERTQWLGRQLDWLSKVAGSEAGEQVPCDELKQAILRLSSLLADARPLSVCPDCGGHPRETCPVCGGRGWLRRQHAGDALLSDHR